MSGKTTGVVNAGCKCSLFGVLMRQSRSMLRPISLGQCESYTPAHLLHDALPQQVRVECRQRVQDVRRAQVAGHHNDCVLEVDRPTLRAAEGITTWHRTV
jgi:hypothetical protein